MKSLIITTPTHGLINPNFTHLLSAAEKINSTCDVLIIGNNLANSIHDISNYEIIQNILTLDDPSLEHFVAENIANQLAELIKGYTHVLVAADSFGKNLLPRIAGILEIGQISEIIDIISPNIFKRFIYTGNVLSQVESLEEIKLLTVRTTNFAIYEKRSASPKEIHKLSLTNPAHPQIRFVDEKLIDKSIDLAFAKVVVSGGRSLSSKEDFDMNIGVLARKLKAAVGATRAAVDAGYASNDCQVGQTGKVVAPQLYLAIGISGAAQHIAGMKDSQTVIAINTDQTAPIFEHADYGLIADLFEVVPQLIEKISTLSS